MSRAIVRGVSGYHDPMFTNPPLTEIRSLLQKVKTIAIVGYSPRPERPSHRVAAALQARGYRIIPVRPAISEGLGETAYARVADLPEVPDLVDVFRQPAAVDAIVDDCIALGVKNLWLQDGVINEAAALRAQAVGMTVVMDRCTLRDQGLLA
ncbi:CoA-binding protein [Georgfuchsia toluolica]|uniref:CoA-binding protein n=1 Tax=Georgfuchsia toluolica TaxID=424218 RepID=A0A916J8W4_9PROT|nr:CoA-binding protein [Georgfuchsia toluolica]